MCKKPLKYTTANDMLPDYTQDVFSGMTITELGLISRKQPVMRINFTRFCRRISGNVFLVENKLSDIPNPNTFPLSATSSRQIFFFGLVKFLNIVISFRVILIGYGQLWNILN